MRLVPHETAAGASTRPPPRGSHLLQTALGGVSTGRPDRSQALWYMALYLSVSDPNTSKRLGPHEATAGPAASCISPPSEPKSSTQPFQNDILKPFLPVLAN